MKKIIALAIAIMMLAALAVPAFAANGDPITADGGESTSLLTYTLGEAFTVTIPETIAFDTSGDATQDITATGNIGIGKSLTIALTSANMNTETDKWYIKDGAETVEYTVAVDDDPNDTPVAPEGIFFTMASGVTSLTETLIFDIETLPTKAGTYTDTLTFTVDVDVA